MSTIQPLESQTMVTGTSYPGRISSNQT